MTRQHYQDQGFAGIKKLSNNDALAVANKELRQAIKNTPESERYLYRSVIRFEGDGYAWYWILK